MRGLKRTINGRIWGYTPEPSRPVRFIRDLPAQKVKVVADYGTLTPLLHRSACFLSGIPEHTPIRIITQT